MLIKAVTNKGDAVPLNAEESLVPALWKMVKQMNTLERVYWLRPSTLVKKSQSINATIDGSWEAVVEGTVQIGHTDTKTDLFHKSVPHKFFVHYKPGKDEIGLPDVGLVKHTVALVN